MIFEWDEKKDKTNAKKHGFGFRYAVKVFFDSNRIEHYDEKHSSVLEDRFLTIGMSDATHIITVSFTERNGIIRIISARFSDQEEINEYYSNK